MIHIMINQNSLDLLWKKCLKSDTL